ncbi:MAG TPA: glycosyltransferase 87 family protein [Solirubrobacterales bacterium]|nr:glycosyltransferase 87 family protein [Solirubrobacterales bacterium]
MDVRTRTARRLAPVAALLAAALAALALLGDPGSAAAQPVLPGSTERTPVPDSLPRTPDDYVISARRALRIADGDPKVVAMREERGPLTASVSTEAVKRWEVGYFAGDTKVVLIVVDGVTGEVLESWTGSQVAWPMARGKEGQFGHILNAPYVWIPMALVFFLALLDWRRPGRIAHLDLLVLLSFGISHAFFNDAEIGISVPLYYPPLVYLLLRMLWVGFGGRSRPLRPSLPLTAMIVLCVALAVFRITINVADSGVIDVGYAGVVGADRINDAEPIYGEGVFPENNPHGDTYGPANYFAYVPFELILPWSGDWDALYAARAAAIIFDLLCIAGLVVLGLRLAGRRLAATLALAWLAYPYTAFVLQSNSNDSLLAAALIWSLALFAQPLARGALLAVAALTKFAPLVLAPLYLAGKHGLAGLRGSVRERARPALLYAGAFALAAVLLLAHPVIDPGVATFWERTVGSQAGRVSPFSIWGQADLEWLHTLVKLGVVVLAIAIALVPRERTMTQIAALGAAVMIAVEITAEHWFYLYIVWFLPLLLLAITYRAEPGSVRSGR